MRKVFIDCGAHNGNSVRSFREHYPGAEEFEIFSFEPNRELAGCWPITGVLFYNKAVWIKDGQITFYKKGTSQGCTVNKFKGKRYPDKDEVDCIDLSKWMRKQFEPEDHIVLKMDIEGAEYAVIEKLVRDKTITYVNELHGELHAHKCGMTKEDDSKLIRSLAKHDLVMYSWDADKGRIKRLIYTDPLVSKKWPNSTKKA